MAGTQKNQRVVALFNNRLRELKMTRTDLIRKFHATYGDIGSRNHLYKVLNGTSTVGEHGMLPMICKLLGIELDEAVKAVHADKITDKGWASALPKANKNVQEIAIIMETLSHRDQAELLQLARVKAGRA